MSVIIPPSKAPVSRHKLHWSDLFYDLFIFYYSDSTVQAFSDEIRKQPADKNVDGINQLVGNRQQRHQRQ